MEFKNNRLNPGDDLRNGNICKFAYLMHSEARPTLGIANNEPLDEVTSSKVLMGLGIISLKDEDYSFHSLSQNEANQVIDQLFGTADTLVEMINLQNALELTEKKQMEDYASRFVTALDTDVILPEDF